VFTIITTILVFLLLLGVQLGLINLAGGAASGIVINKEMNMHKNYIKRQSKRHIKKW